MTDAMRALTVSKTALRVRDVPDPEPAEGELLVDAVALGICGTDREIVAGGYGIAPPGRDHLILGHESLGRVRTAAPGFDAGDMVVGVVRRPDPEPCGACARGQFDMCRNGRYTERGIKELDGYGSELWTVDARYAVKLPPSLAVDEIGVLLEPASVVAKAWEQVERIGNRAWFEPRTVLVTGAGPIGQLAALLGVQRGLDVHVLDRVADGIKPQLVTDLGATYHHEPADEVLARLRPGIVIEATGAGSLVFAALAGTTAYGIVCLTGVSMPGKPLTLDAGELGREIVLENDAVVGSVNANLSHYALAADALSRADAEWLARMITRRVPLDQAADAFDSPDGVKTVITF
jgi:threonine dehydrogenase-like Zn-dependent dehydrogenase